MGKAQAMRKIADALCCLYASLYQYIY